MNDKEAHAGSPAEPYPVVPYWNPIKVRRPTVEECRVIGRDISYASAKWGDGGDCVIETIEEPDAQAALAKACEDLGMCDAAHVIPAGVYLEE
jgi:hypothetical protein